MVYRDYLVNGSEVHIDIYDDRMEIYSLGGMPDGSLIQKRDPTQDVTQDSLDIIKLIRKNNKISTDKIAMALGGKHKNN